MNHDRTLALSTGASRKAVRWTRAEMAWSALTERLKTPIRGGESHAAYMRMGKAQQDELKDVGGFVGGTLKEGRRKQQNVTGRDVVTLDMDAIPAGGTDDALSAVSALGCASCVYSTRKHEPERPRLRVLIPLDRTVTAEEYEPIARRIASWLGLEKCDPTCFQVHQPMYWPSASSDSEYVYDVNDAPFMDADSLLNSYKDWRDMSEWPRSAQERRTDANRTKGRQEDPDAKTGLIGAFCRVYGIRRAMEELIPGVYDPTNDPDRFTYAMGSTTGGAILYEDKWLYSHHATDPACGRLLNAWDLVRVHLYGAKDEDVAAGTPANRMPSAKAMTDLALSLDDVKRARLDEQRAQITEDFGTAPPDGDWRLSLDLDNKGHVKGSLVNLKLIFDNDTALQCIGRDTFQQRTLVRGKLPWNADESERDWMDEDDTGAAWYVEAAYGVTDLRRIKMATDAAMAERETDTLKDYLDTLQWDGVRRVDELLIKYLRAEDSPYTRAVTRKTLCGAVARAYEPGYKFDTVLTLTGPQGIGKSMFLGILGGSWYTDNIQTFLGKEAAEQLRGVWIVEIAEVDRFSAKYEAAAVKQFITRQDDLYREPYARRTMPHPRRCIFTATTNTADFLTDSTGNRRWWVVPCLADAQHRGADMRQLKAERDQIWAEAVTLWRAGEPLTLGANLYAQALSAQERAQMDDPWRGLILEFAEREVPENWANFSPNDRVVWWADEFGQRAQKCEARQTLCVAEVWRELFGGDPKTLDQRNSRRIMNILRQLDGWEDIGVKRTVYGRQKCIGRIVKVPSPDDSLAILS